MGRKSKDRRENGAATAVPFQWPPIGGDLGCGHCPTDDDETHWHCRKSDGSFDPEHVARAYLAHESWAFSCVSDLQRNHPDACFEFVRIALPLCRSDRERAILAAGALESMLGSHGARMIDRVEQEARRDPAFKELLGGVWQHGMPDEIWARVLLASGRTPLKRS
jgi:hypothetical protein